MKKCTEDTNTAYKVLLIKSAGENNRSCEYNRGSFAVIISAARQIREYTPNVEISTLIQISSKLAKKYGLTVIQKDNLKKYGDYSLNHSIMMSTMLIRAAFWRLFMNLGKDINFIKNVNLLNQFENADVIVDLSLDSYGENYGFLPLWETSKELLISYLLYKPTIIYAQSVGPFNGRISSKIARFTLNKVNIISVREEISLDYLKKLGIINPNIYLTADPAFILDPEPTNLDEIIGKNSSDIRPIVGISISKMKEARGKNKFRILSKIFQIVSYVFPDYVTDYFVKISLNVSRIDKVEFNWLNSVIEHLVKNYNASVLLIPHIISDQKEILGDDRTAISKLYMSLDENCKRNVYPISEPYSSEQLKGIIGTCDIFIGEKMHTNIAALSQYVPTLALAYSHKFQGIMKMLGQDDYVLDSTDIGLITKKIDDLWINKEKIKNELTDKMVHIREKSLYNGKLVAKLLQGYQ